MELLSKKIGIIGLGYVGLPLAVEFAKKYKTIGFDINKNRISEIKKGIDKTLEINKVVLSDILKKGMLNVTNDILLISECSIYIITVPTPIDKNNRPVLTPLIKASELVGAVLKKGDIVIYESTVYPGVTEEICVPILTKFSKLKYNSEFFAGYSPERINPGDKKYTVANIKKVTSGSTSETAKIVDTLYKSIIIAGTYKASSIKVAEAAKVIENSQRDINIAFVNELAKIFNLLKIDTNEVLNAAATKWNFLNFKPGLVGGHCIGVDPYYLAQKAQEIGYHSEIILAGRRLNDGMGKYIAQETIKLMLKKGIKVNNSNILILGFTFKENCPDVRNTKVNDIYNELITFGSKVNIYDPIANSIDVKREYNINLLKKLNASNLSKYSAIVICVAHEVFKTYNIKRKKSTVIFDVKSMLDIKFSDARL
jgi:UDP-N-acetyl-D-galactosamine dehydrogenase